MYKVFPKKKKKKICVNLVKKVSVNVVSKNLKKLFFFFHTLKLGRSFGSILSFGKVFAFI